MPERKKAPSTPVELDIEDQDHLSSAEFESERQRLMEYFSRPSAGISREVILSRATRVISENPLKVVLKDYETDLEGNPIDALVTYSPSGLPVEVEAVNGEFYYKREYGDKGYILNELIRRSEPEGGVIEQECKLYYKPREGMIVLDGMDIYPYHVRDGKRAEPYDHPFVITFSDLPVPRKPWTGKSAPSI